MAPRFNLAPTPDNLDPVWPPAPSTMGKVGPEKPTSRAALQQWAEKSAGSVPVLGGVLKPLTQFMGVVSSPDFVPSAVTGPANAISKFGNMLGDLVQRKPVDTGDAWEIKPEQMRAVNPIRAVQSLAPGLYGQPGEVTPSDESAVPLGGVAGGAVAGGWVFKAGEGLLGLAGTVRALQAGGLVRSSATAAGAGAEGLGLTVAKNVLGHVGKGLAVSATAAPFIDADYGNTSNLIHDLTGLKVPGAVEKGDNYLTALGKNLAVDAVAVPLAMLGLGSFLAPVRRALATGDASHLEAIGKAELDPYHPRPQLALPPGRSPLPDPPAPAPPMSLLLPADAMPSWPVQAGGRIDKGTRLQIKQLTDEITRLRAAGDEEGASKLMQQFGDLRKKLMAAEAPTAGADAGTPFNPLPTWPVPPGGQMNKALRFKIKQLTEEIDLRRASGDHIAAAPLIDEFSRLRKQLQASEAAPYDSAISRAQQDQTQIRQVGEQRQRLQDMGLVEAGEGGQLKLSLGGVGDPEIEAQIRQLQVQRGQLIKQGMEAGGGVNRELQQLEAEVRGRVEEQKAALLKEGGETGQDMSEQIALLERDAQDELQQRRKELIAKGVGDETSKAIAEVDQQIRDLTETGKDRTWQPEEGAAPHQPEADQPDPRPELDTFLAHLDEMSDKQLRDLHSRVVREDGEQRRALETQAAQEKVQAIQDRIAEIEQRRAVGEQAEVEGAQPARGKGLTATGARRLLKQAQQELEAAQAALRSIEERARVPEALVGDQLNLHLEQQLALDMTPEVQLPPIREITRSASEYGYATAEDYRAALQSWNRDQLRRLTMPESSPEVAALVKARTGRRVWSAKKADLIDALVEMAERRDSFLPPTPEQLALELRANQLGDWATLFDEAADLEVPGKWGKAIDREASYDPATLRMTDREVPVPIDDYSGRGIDAATREKMKGQILQRAIDNGEVQAPITPIPERPTTTFQQGSLVEDLFGEPTGDLALQFASDELPTYKAGGKGGDALIEEMRLRFEYQALDAKAQQAMRDAYMAEKFWSFLPWEEKKRLMGEAGPLADEFFVPEFKPELDVAAPRDPAPYQNQGTTKAGEFNPQLEAKAPREAAPYRMTFDKEGDAQITENIAPPAAAKPAEPVTPATAKALKAKAKAEAKAIEKQTAEAKAAATRTIADAKARMAAREATLQKLTDDHTGAKC
jgi:hypothetical protein